MATWYLRDHWASMGPATHQVTMERFSPSRMMVISWLIEVVLTLDLQAFLSGRQAPAAADQVNKAIGSFPRLNLTQADQSEERTHLRKAKPIDRKMTMTRSKIIPIMLAAACGLALQFQASGANAQNFVPSEPNVGPEFGTAGNTYNTNVTPNYYMYEGSPSICSPVVGNCLVKQTDGNLVLYSYEGVYLGRRIVAGTPIFLL
jgi:hypothetical protein